MPALKKFTTARLAVRFEDIFSVLKNALAYFNAVVVVVNQKL
jgi:hypothetical protein